MGESDENSHAVVDRVSVEPYRNFAGTGIQEGIRRSGVRRTSRSTAVKVKGGTMLFLAGHTASLPQVNVEHGNFEAQFKRVFDKIKTTLSQGGASFDDIVTMSVFLTDLRYIPEFNKLSKEIFKKNFPAVTFVEVSHLARPQLIMEIQPIAVIP